MKRSVNDCSHCPHGIGDRKDTLVYLACPLSHPKESVVKQRVRIATLCTAWGIRRGYVMFSPITHSVPVAETGVLPATYRDMVFWQDRVILSRCDELWVLMLDGWSTAPGVLYEIGYAVAHEMPVRWVTPKDVDAWAKEVRDAR